jgi:hypothetical protein
LGIGLLFGQFEYGEILGTVRDASQAVVVGAKVTLRNLDTNVVGEGVTNEQGDYSFPGQRSGTLFNTVRKGGFSHSDDVEPRIADRRSLTHRPCA